MHDSLDLAFLHVSQLVQSEVPGSSRRLDIQQEVTILKSCLGDCGKALAVRFGVATKENLLGVINRGCRLLHISGHGDPTSLVLEDGYGGIVHVDVETLREALVQGGSELQFVFISACFSERAALAFQAAGVPHVIAVQEAAAIADSAAKSYAREVYTALFNGRTVKRAFEKGRAGVTLKAGRAPAPLPAPSPSPVPTPTPTSASSSHSGTSSPSLVTPSSGVNTASPSPSPAPASQSQSSALLGGQAAPPASSRRRTDSCCCSHLHAPTCLACPTCGLPRCCAVHASPCHSVLPCCRPDVPHGDSAKFLLLPLNGNHDVVLFPTVSTPSSAAAPTPAGASVSSSSSSLLTPAGGSSSPAPQPQPYHVPAGPWIDVSPPLPPTNLALPPDHFVGRANATHSIIQNLRRHRIVSIVGVVGVGKTALGRAVGHYLNERAIYAEGVFAVELRKVTCVRDVVSELLAIFVQHFPAAFDSAASAVINATQASSAASSALDAADALHQTRKQQLFHFLRHRHMLLVLDEVDLLLSSSSSSSSFVQLVNELVSHHGHLRLLITARTSMHGLVGGGHRTFVVEPLHPLDVANLFMLRMPRDLHLDDFPAGTKFDAVQNIHDIALLLGPVLRRLYGNPRLVETVADLLADCTLEQISQLLDDASNDRLQFASLAELNKFIDEDEFDERALAARFPMLQSFVLQTAAASAARNKNGASGGGGAGSSAAAAAAHQVSLVALKRMVQIALQLSPPPPSVVPTSSASPTTTTPAAASSSPSAAVVNIILPHPTSQS